MAVIFQATAGACKYCLARADAGRAYRGEYDMIANFHDACNCQAVPVFDDDEGPDLSRGGKKAGAGEKMAAQDPAARKTAWSWPHAQVMSTLEKEFLDGGIEGAKKFLSTVSHRKSIVEAAVKKYGPEVANFS